MLENLETLIVLHRQGTMAKASTVLRVSQSAVSKRIASVEAYYGKKLVERSGRGVVLTGEALSLLGKLAPLLAEIRNTLSEKRPASKKKVIFGVSESILSSWGAEKLDAVFRKCNLEVEYHCHRSPLVIEKIESGIYDLGFCSGKITSSRSLISEPIHPEEMVLIADGSKKFKTGKSFNILSIEKSSATWKAIREDINRRKLIPTTEVESFFSIAQLAKSGRGVGLVPLGVARALAVKKNCIFHFKPKITRPIQIVYKKSRLERPFFKALVKELEKIEP